MKFLRIPHFAPHNSVKMSFYSLLNGIRNLKDNHISFNAMADRLLGACITELWLIH